MSNLKTFRIAAFSTGLILIFSSSLVVKSEAQAQPNVPPPPSNKTAVTEADVQRKFMEAQARKRDINTTAMAANALEGRGKPKRPTRAPLPADWVSPRHQKPLPCGGTYEVAKDGYIRFEINSPHDPCYLAFLGSRAERCTVGLLCDGVLTLGNCQHEYFKMGDGTIGASERCGGFDFAGVPRVSRNKGPDLYVLYKGQSQMSPCVAFCMEDLPNSNAVLYTPVTLQRSSFPGFPPVGTGTCECGRRNDIGRIVGGTAASKFEFPWLAALVFKGFPSYERIPFCDGALISDSHVITAAHCFDDVQPDQIQVLLRAHVMDKSPNNGDYSESSAKDTPGWDLPKATDQSEGSIRVDIAKIVVHPLFNKYSFDYDVAILKLKKKVNFDSGKVSPICLPLMSERFNFQDLENMIVAGWGASSENSRVSTRLLQKLDVPFVEHKRCLQYMPASKRHVCAGYLEGAKDSCTGDSGGPLIYDFNPTGNQFILSGIVSSGSGCARKDKLGLYTDVQEVIQWVYHHTASDPAIWCSR